MSVIKTYVKAKKKEAKETLVEYLFSSGFSLATSSFVSTMKISPSGDSVKMTENYLIKKFPECTKFSQSSAYGSAYSGLSTSLTFIKHCIIPIKLPQNVIMFIRKDSFCELQLIFVGIKAKEACVRFQDALSQHTEILEIDEDDDDKHLLSVFTLSCDDDNEMQAVKRRQVSIKTLDEVIIDKDIKKKLTDYLFQWKKSQNLFDKIGITHKVGILLYGPPGTGKTSLAKAIAYELGYKFYTMPLTVFSQGVPDFSSQSDGVVLLEDIDYFFSRTGKENNEQAVHALLQTLDGAASGSNIIFIATTNSIELLNEATIRDGRFDLKLHLDNIQTESAAREMCYALSLNKEETDSFLQSVSYPVNPAELQNQCIQYLFRKVSDQIEHE